MAVTYNIKGTTNSSFKVGKQGTGTVYAGSVEADDLQAKGNLTVTGNLVVSGTTTTVSSTTIDVKNSFRFEGATADAHETILTVEDPTADRTVTIPNATTTLVGADTTQTLTNKTLTSPIVNNAVLTGLKLTDSSIVFEGATDDAHEITLTVVDPTADRTITLPNSDGIVVTQDSTTGMMSLPVGTTVQRPGSPVTGSMRFNSTTKRFEGYNGIQWVAMSPYPDDITTPRDGDPVQLEPGDLGSLT